MKSGLEVPPWLNNDILSVTAGRIEHYVVVIFHEMSTKKQND